MNLTVICAMTGHVSIVAVSAVESKKDWAITDVFRRNKRFPLGRSLQFTTLNRNYIKSTNSKFELVYNGKLRVSSDIFAKWLILHFDILE